MGEIARTEPQAWSYGAACRQHQAADRRRRTSKSGMPATASPFGGIATPGLPAIIDRAVHNGAER